MRASPLRTISGRIVLGFLALFAAFAGVSGYAIWQMNRLGRDIQFVRAAYLDVIPSVSVLVSLQSGLIDYLDEPSIQKPRVERNRAQQEKALAAIEQQLEAVSAVPAAYRKEFAGVRERVLDLRAEHQQSTLLVEAALGADRTSEAARSALGSLKNRERRIKIKLTGMQQSMQTRAKNLLLHVERATRQARLWALGLGGAAAGFAVLIAVWAIVTLRPLARLRDGARRVAQGDYRGRVQVSGGTEVAELANELNAMAAAIEEREQKLVRSERLAAVGKMAAVITHEIRNPLSSLGLNAELLEEELAKGNAAGAEAKDLLRAMQKEVDRLTAITEEYLRFARLPRPRLEPEQVNEIVSGLVEFQKGELEQKGVRVRAELDPRLPLVAADEGQLRQALLNLIRNAADAMKEGGGELTLATRGEDGVVEVRVSDTGPGIDAADLPRIFEPFYSTKEGGTGLGLALTQQIVAEHGGEIEVDSARGRGTTFVVKLPRSA